MAWTDAARAASAAVRRAHSKGKYPKYVAGIRTSRLAAHAKKLGYRDAGYYIAARIRQSPVGAVSSMWPRRRVR